jgi:hypothetical protein
MTDHPTTRLSAYLDGDLPDAAERARIEAHLMRCGECARTLDELRRVARQARGLRDADAPPPAPAVWDAIARHVEGRAAAPPQRAGVRWRRLTLTVPQLIAAGLTLMLASAGGGYLLHRAAAPGAPEDTRFAAMRADTGVPAVPAPPPAESAIVAAARPAVPNQSRRPGTPAVVPVVLPWAQYDTAAADLERILEEGRGKLRPETVRAIEQSVASIDRAIRQARQALTQDPANEYLSRHLAETMKRKLELLRQAAAIVGQQS